MVDANELLVAQYIKDLDTGYLGRIEGYSSVTVDSNDISSECDAVIGTFVTDEGKIIKKTVGISRIEIVDQESADDFFETLITILNIRKNRLIEFYHGVNDTNQD